MRTQTLGLSVVTLNAGPLGVVGLFGSRRDMKILGEAINVSAGKAIPPQPTSHLVPAFPPSALMCRECRVWQQHHSWDATPAFCHACLRTFIWTETDRERVLEMRECLKEGRTILQMPSHLADWARQEYRDKTR